MVNTGSDEEKKRNPIADFVAGGLSGGTTRLIVAPLDVIKIRFQVQVGGKNREGVAIKPKYTSVRQTFSTIIKEEGVLALWKGNLTAEYLWIAYAAIQFAAYKEAVKIACPAGETPTTRHYFIGGAVAGAAATVTSYPFDLMRTRLAAQGEPKIYHSLRDCVSRTVQEGGIKSLWRGVTPTIVQIIPLMAVQFSSYEALKKAYMNRIQQKVRDKTLTEKKINPAAQLVCGAIAGIISKLGVLPMDVVKKRLQMSGIKRSEKYGAAFNYTGMVDCIRKIAQNEGFSSFYKGAVPSMLKAAPSAALSFMFFEQFKELLSM